MKIKSSLLTLVAQALACVALLPVVAHAQALSGLPNPGLTSAYIQIPNASTTGTTLFTLTKLTTVSGTSTAVITATTDTSGVVGIAVNGVGASGSVLIQVNGLVYCNFDNSGTTAGDYVGISSTTAGDCHDVGFGPPASAPSGQILGQILSTNASGGTYVMRLSLHQLSRVTWTGNGGSGSTAAASDFFTPSGMQAGTTPITTDNQAVQMTSPVTGTIEDLRCATNVAQGAGISDVFTVDTGTFGSALSASSVTCTATNATSCSDSTHSASVTAGQAIDIKDAVSGAAAARTLACSFDLVF